MRYWLHRCTASGEEEPAAMSLGKREFVGVKEEKEKRSSRLSFHFIHF